MHSSEIKGLERGGRAIISFHGHLFPSHDRGNSKLALLQDLGGKICLPTTTANSALGECSRGVSVIKGHLHSRGFHKGHCPSMVCQGEGRDLLSASWPPTGEVEVSCLASQGLSRPRATVNKLELISSAGTLFWVNELSFHMSQCRSACKHCQLELQGCWEHQNLPGASTQAERLPCRSST